MELPERNKAHNSINYTHTSHTQEEIGSTICHYAPRVDLAKMIIEKKMSMHMKFSISSLKLRITAHVSLHTNHQFIFVQL